MSFVFSSFNIDTAVQEKSELTFGVDLSLLSAQPDCLHSGLGLDTEVECVSASYLASAVNAAGEGGFDAVVLSKDFLTRSDHKNATNTYDSIKTMERLYGSTSASLTAGISVDSASIDAVCQSFVVENEVRGCVEILADDLRNPQVCTCLEKLKNNGVKICVYAQEEDVERYGAATIVRYASTVRLRVADPHKARELRVALRLASEDEEKKVDVLCDFFTVVSADRRAANERVHFMEVLHGSEFLKNKHIVAGSVYDIADTIEEWVTAGACDGFVFYPASVSTDLASLIRGVLPLVKARGTL
ncbi:MAG: hypothetical protein J6M18_03040 [Actinomycetaceae bacterium]|nr:hypothetical protein [Actinomycetaceae bacterium]